jgi:hypothetical protein
VRGSADSPKIPKFVSIDGVTRITREPVLSDDNPGVENSRYPELIIGHEPDGEVSAAACIACGEMIAEIQPPYLEPKDAIVAFSALFQLHVKKKHPQFVPN